MALDVAIGSCRAADALCVGVEHIEQEIAVAQAVPAPVDVEHAVAVITVADKGMATCSLIARVDDGPSCGQLGIEQVVPALGAVVLAALDVGTGLVAKVGADQLRDAK